MEVCIERDLKCDGIVHCDGEEDEAGCYAKYCIGRNCDKYYKMPKGGS